MPTTPNRRATRLQMSPHRRSAKQLSTNHGTQWYHDPLFTASNEINHPFREWGIRLFVIVQKITSCVLDRTSVKVGFYVDDAAGTVGFYFILYKQIVKVKRDATKRFNKRRIIKVLWGYSINY